MKQIKMVSKIKSLYINSSIINVPISVSYEITKRCNLHCYHCYNQFSHNEKDELNLDDKIKMIHKITELGAVEITLCGGEPMISKDFLDVVRISKQNGLIVNVLTNGFFASDYIIKSLKEVMTQYDSIQISIDDFPQMGRRQRNIKISDYKYLLHNIRRFQTLNCFTYVSITPTIYNQLYILDILKFLKEEADIYAFGATPYLPFGGIKMDSLKPNYIFLNETEKKKIEYCDENNIQFLGGVKGHVCQCITESNNKIDRENYKFTTRECDAAKYNMHISCDGSLYPCVFMVHNNFKFANIRSDIELIKYNLANIGQKICSIPMPSKCIQCNKVDICNGGCPGLVFDRYLNLEEVDPRCEKR